MLLGKMQGVNYDKFIKITFSNGIQRAIIIVRKKSIISIKNVKKQPSEVFYKKSCF